MSNFFDFVVYFLTEGIWEQLYIFWTSFIDFVLLYSYRGVIGAAEFMGNYTLNTISELDIAAPFVAAIGFLPDDIKGVMNILNFPTALAIVVGAHGIAAGIRFFKRFASFLLGFAN